MKLITDVALSAESQPDPYILEAGGKFYIYATSGYGVAVYRSDNLFGGYEKLGETGHIEGRTAYWAPSVIEMDGKFYMYVSCMPEDSDDAHDQAMFVLTADKPEGPYRRLSPEPVLEGFNVEDPFAWHDGKEFHIWAKDMEGTITGELHAGAHFVSADGIRWTYREKAYSRSIRNRNGEMIHLGCLERPQLLFDENGEPEYLFAAAADGPGGFRNAFNTWNIAVALNE